MDMLGNDSFFEDLVNDFGVTNTPETTKKDPDNSTANQKQRKQDIGVKKRKRCVLELDTDEHKLQYEQQYAEGYFSKLQENLTDIEYEKVVKALNEFEKQPDNIIELYNEIINVMLPYKHLKFEFLGLLTPKQALQCGIFKEYMTVCHNKEFIRKLNVHFQKQPHQIKKVINAIERLSMEDPISMEIVKNTILPLLKGNAVLVDAFLQLWPQERPSNSMVCDNWEDINTDNEYCGGYESIQLPEHDEVQNCEVERNGEKCLYGCSEKGTYQNCTVCNLKFINGRMYVQCGKLLKPAVITFTKYSHENNIKRLTGKSCEEIITPPKIRSHKKTTDTNKCNVQFIQQPNSPVFLATESDDDLLEGKHKGKKKRKIKLPLSENTFHVEDLTKDLDAKVEQKINNKSTENAFSTDVMT